MVFAIDSLAGGVVDFADSDFFLLFCFDRAEIRYRASRGYFSSLTEVIWMSDCSVSFVGLNLTKLQYLDPCV